jgi:PAS domain S-box-containing protein
MPFRADLEALEPLRPLLDALPLPTLVFDTGWRVLMASPAALYLFGWTEAELQTLTVDAMVPEQLRDRYRSLRERAPEPNPDKRIFYRGERVVRTKDGREVPIEFVVARATVNGVAVHVSSFMDLSSHKEAEAETLEHLHSLIENAEDGIFVIRVEEDGEFCFETFNPVSERLTGFTSEQARGRRPHQLVPEPEASRLVQGYRRAVELGTPMTFEESPGEVAGNRVFRTTLVPIRDVHGRVHRLLGVSRDITDQRQAESALAETRVSLAESEDRFRKAFRASPHPIGITEMASARLVEVNDAFERVFEHSREQAVGKSTVELGLWADPQDRERMVAMLRRDGSFRDLDVIGRTRHGRELNLVLSGEQIDIGGQPHLVTYVHDVTERVTAERESASLEQQLRQAQKMDALGTMAGGIAHDFNNILGAIMAYTDLVRLDIASPVQVENHLNELRRAGARARELVRKILTFARRDPTTRRPARLDVAVRDALELLRATVPATVQIDSSIDPRSPVVFADLTEIHQVVTNLGTNAAHAMQGGVGRLSVRLESVNVDAALASRVSALRPRTYARIRVEDTGHGMTQETVSRVFEPFFTTKSRGEGTGLGLSVVHGIVREHDGAIVVESTPGVGTRFDVYFPGADVDSDREAAQPEVVSHGAGERILLIDDEEVIARSISQLLDRLGYVVTTHLDPVAALHGFCEQPTSFDLVLTDLTMPTMTGVDLARRMLEVDPSKPIIVMSGFSGTWSADSLKELGIAGLLQKPLGAADLTSAISSALKGPRG